MAYENTRYNSNPRMGGSGNNYRRSYGQGDNQSQNGSRSKTEANCSTSGVILPNDKVGKFLRTSFWNGTLGLEIGTYAPGTTLNHETVRNAQVFGHVFSFSTIFELKEICDDVMDALHHTNTFESTATEAGQKKDIILEISNGSNINMTPGIYLVIYKNVDSGKRSNSYEIYPFGATRVLRGYDHSSGTAKEDIKANGNFKKFIKILDEAANAFTMAQAHAVANVRKSEKMATFTALSAIAAGMGVDVTKSVNDSTRVSSQPNYSRKSDTQQKPEQYRRQYQPNGQWNGNNNRSYPGNNSQNRYGQNNYQQTRETMAAISDEPVDINLDAATLQNVNINDFK